MRDFLFLTPRWLPVGRGPFLSEQPTWLPAVHFWPAVGLAAPSKANPAPRGPSLVSHQRWPPVGSCHSHVQHGCRGGGGGPFPGRPAAIMATAPALCLAYRQDGYHGNPFPGLLPRWPSSSAYNQDGRQECQPLRPSPGPPHQDSECLFLFLRLQGGGAILGGHPSRPPPPPREQETPRLWTPPRPRTRIEGDERHDKGTFFCLFCRDCTVRVSAAHPRQRGPWGAEPWGVGAEPWGAGSCTHF